MPNLSEVYCTVADQLLLLLFLLLLAMSDIKGSRLLKGNWVEAQAISHLDDEIEEGYTTSAKVGRDGHKGLIALDNALKETVSSTKGSAANAVRVVKHC